MTSFRSDHMMMTMMMSTAVTGFMNSKNQKADVTQTLAVTMVFVARKARSSSATVRSLLRGRNAREVPNTAEEADVAVENVSSPLILPTLSASARSPSSLQTVSSIQYVTPALAKMVGRAQKMAMTLTAPVLKVSAGASAKLVLVTVMKGMESHIEVM